MCPLKLGQSKIRLRLAKKIVKLQPKNFLHAHISTKFMFRLLARSIFLTGYIFIYIFVQFDDFFWP